METASGHRHLEPLAASVKAEAGEKGQARARPPGFFAPISWVQPVLLPVSRGRLRCSFCQLLWSAAHV